MPNVGPLELIVVLIIALVIFGPKRLPELGRSMGKGIREFRGSISGKDDDEDDDDDDEKSSKPAAIEGAQDADEPVEGEVVTNQRS
jgi:sec-independent protein translocase protein TatA